MSAQGRNLAQHSLQLHMFFLKAAFHVMALPVFLQVFLGLTGLQTWSQKGLSECAVWPLVSYGQRISFLISAAVKSNLGFCYSDAITYKPRVSIIMYSYKTKPTKIVPKKIWRTNQLSIALTLTCPRQSKTGKCTSVTFTGISLKVHLSLYLTQ